MEIKYRRIRADFEHAEKGRFYRVFLVPEDIPLTNLGLAMVEMLHGTMEHCFLFSRRDGIDFVSAAFLFDDDFEGYIWMKGHSLMDLWPDFRFTYDTGDGWDFKCKIYQKTITKTYEDEFDVPMLIILEGAGQGIWEDHIGLLYDYLEGMIPPTLDHEDPDKDIYFPWNVVIKQVGDFDIPLDIEEENDTFSLDDFFIEEYNKREEEYAEEYGVKEVSLEDYRIQGALDRTKRHIASAIEYYVLSTYDLPREFISDEDGFARLARFIEQGVESIDVEGIADRAVKRMGKMKKGN